ncbi:hypothetical protein BDY21DRAFT_80808 [Lineolata rhizophorae]|uniref:BTB domain-containing protein n=1 Tax=Lineolata rhizophorae TaxID=578093 RepID=A0A6A6NUD6_9PEZI|nr:hypothetical protein BDY21DRAFT_80808 [Lineolata rhizophorae]
MEEDGPVEFCHDGDVLLLVGPGKRVFRVHSFVMGVASPVLWDKFKSEFGLDEINRDCPGLVSLPEDDPFAMGVICSVLHCCRGSLKPNWDDLTAPVLFNIAVLADRYGVTDVMYHHLASWFAYRSLDTSDESLVTLLAAAHLLDDPDMFSGISKDLIWHHSESFVDLDLRVHVDYDFPRSLFHVMEVYRARFFSKFGTEIIKLHDEYKHDPAMVEAIQLGILPQQVARASELVTEFDSIEDAFAPWKAVLNSAGWTDVRMNGKILPIHSVFFRMLKEFEAGNIAPIQVCLDCDNMSKHAPQAVRCDEGIKTKPHRECRLGHQIPPVA